MGGVYISREMKLKLFNWASAPGKVDVELELELALMQTHPVVVEELFKLETSNTGSDLPRGAEQKSHRASQ
uniref:Uncharacterized protein n=1 Tax=Oryza nivara TaxID=4536 RepID=A0A0E0G910_ORYNI